MAVHWIGSVLKGGWQATSCGIYAMKAKIGGNEYETDLNGRIEASFRDWKGVTCKKCLRNPHAPGGKFYASAVDPI